MADFQVVCCMCGDIGFQDKLFRCSRCLNRFQHSYCSNYYTESSVPVEECDWCRSEQRSLTEYGGGSSSSSRKAAARHNSDRVMKPHVQAVEKGKNPGRSGEPLPRTATRRYKLLKDVMC